MAGIIHINNRIVILQYCVLFRIHLHFLLDSIINYARLITYRYYEVMRCMYVFVCLYPYIEHFFFQLYKHMYINIATLTVVENKFELLWDIIFGHARLIMYRNIMTCRNLFIFIHSEWLLSIFNAPKIIQKC